MCMHVCGGVLSCLCVSVQSLEVNNGCVPPYCLRQSLFCESDVSHFALDWLVIETGSSSLHPLCAGVIGTHCQAHCFCAGM